jgi:hypothetical protein
MNENFFNDNKDSLPRQSIAIVYNEKLTAIKPVNKVIMNFKIKIEIIAQMKGLFYKTFCELNTILKTKPHFRKI